MANKRAKILRNTKKPSKSAPPQSDRDVARQPSPKHPKPVLSPLLASPSEIERSTRLRASIIQAHHPLDLVAVNEKKRLNREQAQKPGQQQKHPPQSAPIPPPPIPLQNSPLEQPRTTEARLRKSSRRSNPAASAPETKSKLHRKQVRFEQDVEEAAPLQTQLPSGTICTSNLISAGYLRKNKELAMPVALRRPTTTHRRQSSEKENTRPNGVLTNGNPKGIPNHKKAKPAAHAPHRALSNGDLPGSTHSHASQASAPPAVPSRTEEIDREKALERNIDHVVFGDRMFRAWYPSWYPKEIIGEKALSDAKPVGIVVQTLYVCNKCFGYAKEVHDWAKHCQRCDREIPGARIYSHGAGEGKAEAECVWSVWEVDGGVDTIFCQNLSLFAKLFLDNKSVFFDVSGFNYFLLVHNPTSQIVGFFSKEKMSWDNNNLACILIFPPWQRKNLGLIVMGVSYEISRREEILGGPEKPISDLGKKGYKRFWGREIARWLLEAKETDRKKGKGMVTLGDVSRGTWIHGEDCLGVLREMDVVDKGGKGRGEVERVILDKVKVRAWVDKMGLSLERVVDKEGFVEGYGYQEAVEGEEEAGD